MDKKYYVNYYSVSRYIENASKRFPFPLSQDKVDEILKFAEKVCTNPAFIGNRPRNLAAGIVYAAEKMHGFIASISAICKALGVSQPSTIFLSKKVIRSLDKQHVS